MRIEAKLAGQRRRLFEPLEWEWPDARKMTLRELLSEVIREEVESFRHRQTDGRLVHVLTAEQIADGVTRGKVSSGGSDLDQYVALDEAVATGIEAFKDGFYLVFVDGGEVKDLDGIVTIAPTSTLLFVRLVPLAGG